MRFLDDLNGTPRDRRGDAIARPFKFYVRDFFRMAATIALVSAVFDVLPPASPMTPAVRLEFIVLWSALMAGFHLVINRQLQMRRSPHPPQ